MAEVRKLFLICMLGTLWAGWVSAQRLPDSDIPPVPPTGVLDRLEVLGNNPSLRRQLIELIQGLERDHGFRLLLVVERSLIGTNASDFAAQLQQEWIPEGGGLVVVFESDTMNLGFGRGLEGTEGMIEDEAGIPSFGLVDIVSEALHASQDIEAREVFLEKFITELCGNLDDYFERKKMPVDGSRSLRLALVTIGALSLLALCGMGLGWLMGKADRKQSMVRIFPPVDVPERLGAPYGGGGEASKSFGYGSNH